MTLTDQQLERYARHIILKDVGGLGQKKLLKSKVLIVGAGGLGAPLIMYLAAAGVGTIGIIDDDLVTLSNLQRQIIHQTKNIGLSKTQSSLEMVKNINPDVNVRLYQERLTLKNAETIIKKFDLVADGCDNFETRLLVNDVCYKTQTPLVSGALSQFEGQVATYKPFENNQQNEPYPCYRCLVPENPGDGGGDSCSDQGVLGIIAGVVGTLQATEVLKELLGIGKSLCGKLLIYDALSSNTRLINLKRDIKCKTCGEK
ncbi:MAG: HesA/MoeB/ThiF family protein [Sphingomonadales bacterium]